MGMTRKDYQAVQTALVETLLEQKHCGSVEDVNIQIKLNLVMGHVMYRLDENFKISNPNYKSELFVNPLLKLMDELQVTAEKNTWERLSKKSIEERKENGNGRV